MLDKHFQNWRAGQRPRRSGRAHASIGRRISSYGERLSSRIVTAGFRKAGMDAVHVDARRVLVTDHRHTQAAPLFEATRARLCATVMPLVQAGKIVVMGGFIGATEEASHHARRGGSDSPRRW